MNTLIIKHAHYITYLFIYSLVMWLYYATSMIQNTTKFSNINRKYIVLDRMALKRQMDCENFIFNLLFCILC